MDVFISNVKQQNQVTFLREHFRSTPSLIEFSNEHFYENQLEVLKSTPEFTGQSQIQLIHVDGNRNENGINELEAQAVLLKLDELIETYKNEEKAPSIGIISPFQTQVQYLNKLLEKKYDLETLKKFNLVSGTPYNFQGSEREIILLSFCVCNKTHPSAFHHLNKAEVMNVAITRAKSFQYVFKSVDIQTLKRETLLFKYFHFIEKFNHLDKSIFELDQFQIEVIEELQKNGFNSFKCGYPIAGNILDILVSFNNKNYFIDLIGYPGRYKSAFSLERYQTLSRTGIKTIPLHYSFWSKNKDEAFQKIKDFLLN